MAVKINLYEAKSQLSQLVDRAAAGEEIIIAKNGEPLARLVPVAKRRKRKLGLLRGKVILDAEIEKPLDEETLRLFEEAH
jgi:prevent-host-death family protein